MPTVMHRFKKSHSHVIYREGKGMKKPTVVGAVMALGIAAVILVFLFLPVIYAETSEFPDANSNGIPDGVDVDTDGDGIPTMQESVQGTNPYDAHDYAFVEGIEEEAMQVQAFGEESGEEVEEIS